MKSHFHVFMFVMVFAAAHGIENGTSNEFFLFSPKQRQAQSNNSCMVQTEKSNISCCCVCPGSCNSTFPRNVTRTYSAGLSVLKLYFNSSGQIGKSNLSIQVYLYARNSTSDAVFRECLQRNLLRIVNTTKSGVLLKLEVEMPTNLTCRHCLIQWVITKDDRTINNTLSKQYFGCSDIAILGTQDIDMVDVSSGAGDHETSTESTSVGSTLAAFQTSHRKTTRHSTTAFSCWAVGIFANLTDITEWCIINCQKGNCPVAHCQCTSMPTISFVTSNTTAPSTNQTFVCQAVGAYATVGGMNEWCQMNCIMGYCPKSHCKCSSEEYGVTSEMITQKQLFCQPIGIWAHQPSMYEWCTVNCRRNLCPKLYCTCSLSSMISTTPSQSKTMLTSSVKPSIIISKVLSTTLSQSSSTSENLTTRTELFCRATGVWVTVNGMHEWCMRNCPSKYCSTFYCRCSSYPKTNLSTQSTYTNFSTPIYPV